MTADKFRELQDLIRRRRAEADAAQSEERKSEIWALCAAEMRFKSFEAKEGSEGTK